MYIIERDRQAIMLVARFGQLTASHIQNLLFTNLSSHTPSDRTLKRLVDQRFLARIERRTVGGARGGSGQYVYQLGLEGHKLRSGDRYVPARSVNYHSLAIADCYVTLKRLEQQGVLKVAEYVTEPDSHVTIGNYLLKPDLYAELVRPETGKPIRLMFEIDMGTQGQRQIVGKYERYWNAYRVADESQWPGHQLVLFVAIDEDRAAELRRLLERGNKQAMHLFRIVTAENLASALR